MKGVMIVNRNKSFMVCSILGVHGLDRFPDHGLDEFKLYPEISSWRSTSLTSLNRMQ